MNRFERQIKLKGFGIESQNRLKDSSALIIGIGGLGCPALTYLAAVGVGKIGIVDGDTISLSNLNRQTLFGINDEGEKKVEVAGKLISEKYEDIEIEIFAEFLDNQKAIEIIACYDIILDCTDNFSVRYMLSDICTLLDKPLIYGAIFEYEGQVSSFSIKNKNGETFNYRDLFPKPPAPSEIPNCSDTGVLGVLPGIIGIMQATEAIKILSGNQAELIGKVLYCNLKDYSFLKFDIQKRVETFENIPRNKEEFLKFDYNFFCSALKEISWEEAESILSKNPENSCYVDVREKDEIPDSAFLSPLKISLSEIEKSDSVFDTKTEFLIFCQAGVRSRKAVAILNKRFPDKIFYSVNGGILANHSNLKRNIDED